jgi:hypothetical protein
MSESVQYFLPVVVAPLPAAPGMPGITYQPDHQGEAESRLLVQFDDAVKLHALVRALVKPLQALELAALQVRDAFDVDTAVGLQLDVVGWLVGEDRQGKGDVAYRAYVKARILANASKGRPRDIYRIVRALIGPGPTVELAREPGLAAHYNLSVTSAALAFPWDVDGEVSADIVARAVRDALMLATSGGVSFEIYFQFSANAFEFASGETEESDVDHGFADDDDALTEDGGTFIGVEASY